MKKFIKSLSAFALVLTLFFTGCGNVGTPISSENLEKWGLGEKETRYVCNDRDYEWYIDQYGTGTYWQMNCGPACCVMAAEWYDENFSGTVEGAREEFVLEGKGWSSKEMGSYLKQNGIPFSFEEASISSFKKELNKGNILILLLDMEYISTDFSSEQRVNKYGINSSSHYIIVKGYRVVDGTTYFEVYDPNSRNRVFPDGSPKGKDRYFLADEVITAVKSVWNYYIAISAPEE